jgi:ribosomal protein L11 methyltransferase
MEDRRLQRGGPYDLVIANILAGPLIALAPSLAGALAPGGRLILAGLLDHQAEAVSVAYWRRGMRTVARIDRGGWPTLVLRKRR